MEEFAPIIQAYTEIGILGLLAVLMIILFWRSFQHKNEDDNWRRNKIDDKDKTINDNSINVSKQLADMNTLLKQQNEDYRKFQMDIINKSQVLNEQLIQKIIDGVYYHVPSHSENDKLTDVNVQIDTILQDILDETGASRVNLVQYHNGGKGINKQAFLKMSMTNEKFKHGCKSVMSEFKDQFRSVLGYFVNQINLNGYCYIENLDDMLEKDIGMYEFMCNRGIEAKYGYAVRDTDDYVTGFIGIEFEKKVNADRHKIDTSFREHYREIERLLNT